MRKIIVHCEVGFCGMEAKYPLLVEDDAPDSEIDQSAYELAVEHAASYGYYPLEDYDYEDSFDDEEPGSEYVSSIGGSWEDYDLEEHDMYRPGGGSFEEDFARM